MLNPTYFTPQFFARMPPDTDEATVAIANEYRQMVEKYGSIASLEPDFIEAYAIVEAFVKHHGIEAQLPPLRLPSPDPVPLRSLLLDLKRMASERISKRTAEEVLARKREEYDAVFGKYNGYQFSDSDFARIHELLVEIRAEIDKSIIPSDHKRRLIKRLEAVQGELQQQTAEIDRFWGFMAEAGIVLKKFGEDLKPLSDRITELGRIVICVYMAKEGTQSLPGIIEVLQLMP